MQILHYMVLSPSLFHYLCCWPSCSCVPSPTSTTGGTSSRPLQEQYKWTDQRVNSKYFTPNLHLTEMWVLMWEGWWEKLDSQLVWPPFCVDSQCNFLPQSNNMHAQVDGRFAPRCESESESCVMDYSLPSSYMCSKRTSEIMYGRHYSNSRLHSVPWLQMLLSHFIAWFRQVLLDIGAQCGHTVNKLASIHITPWH